MQVQVQIFKQLFKRDIRSIQCKNAHQNKQHGTIIIMLDYAGAFEDTINRTIIVFINNFY